MAWSKRAIQLNGCRYDSVDTCARAAGSKQQHQLWAPFMMMPCPQLASKMHWTCLPHWPSYGCWLTAHTIVCPLSANSNEEHTTTLQFMPETTHNATDPIPYMGCILYWATTTLLSRHAGLTYVIHGEPTTIPSMIDHQRLQQSKQGWHQEPHCSAHLVTIKPLPHQTSSWLAPQQDTTHRCMRNTRPPPFHTSTNQTGAPCVQLPQQGGQLLTRSRPTPPQDHARSVCTAIRFDRTEPTRDSATGFRNATRHTHASKGA